MTLNFPAPYELRIYYTVNGREHSMRRGVNVTSSPTIGTAFSAITTTARNSTTSDLGTETDGLVAVIAAMYSSSGVTFDYAELWEYVGESLDGSFISSYVLGVNGGSASATTVAHQMTLTFRTTEGGIGRLVCLESTSANQVRQPYASAQAAVKAIMDYLTDATSPFVGRDGGFLLVPMYNSGGGNEAIWRKVYR